MTESANAAPPSAARLVDEIRQETVARVVERHHDEQLNVEGPAGELRRELAAFVQRDRRAEGRKGRFILIALASIGGGFVFVPVIADGLRSWWATGVALLVFGAGFLVALVGYSRGAARDFDDRRVALPRYAIEALWPELHKERPATAWIDFVSIERTVPVKDEAGPTRHHRRRAFEHEWLRLELPLLDETRVRVTLSSEIQREEEWKRRKSYTRYEDTRTDFVDVDVVPPAGSALDELTLDGEAERFGDAPLQRLVSTEVQEDHVRFRFAFGPVHPEKEAHWKIMMLPGLVDGDKLVRAVQFAYEATSAAATRSA